MPLSIDEASRRYQGYVKTYKIRYTQSNPFWVIAKGLISNCHKLLPIYNMLIYLKKKDPQQPPYRYFKSRKRWFWTKKKKIYDDNNTSKEAIVGFKDTVQDEEALRESSNTAVHIE